PVAVPDRAGDQARDVRPAARLGEELAPDLLAAQHGGQVALLLLLGAQFQDRRPGHAEADDERADRQRVIAGLLAERDLLGVGQALAAVLLRPGDACEARVVQLRLEFLLCREAGGPWLAVRICGIRPAGSVGGQP